MLYFEATLLNAHSKKGDIFNIDVHVLKTPLILQLTNQTLSINQLKTFA